jgi:hypothetical protein
MKTEEIRIGNYLDRNGLMEVFQISAKSHMPSIRIYDHVNKCYIDHSFNLQSFNPIPLTEEWLLKFGFAKNSVSRYPFYWHEWGTNGVQIIRYSDIYQKYVFELGAGLDKVLDHVHQLQNLYFALTSEELQPK